MKIFDEEETVFAAGHFLVNPLSTELTMTSPATAAAVGILRGLSG